MKRLYVERKTMFNSSRSIEIRLAAKMWLMLGFNLKQISLGFSLNKYQLNIDLLFFWIAVEF